MMDDIKSGKDGVAYVLVFKLSRFGRNAAVGATGHKCTFRLNIEQTEMNRMVAAIVSATIDYRHSAASRSSLDDYTHKRYDIVKSMVQMKRGIYERKYQL